MTASPDPHVGLPSEEMIARAIAQADEQNGALPYEARMAMGKHVREALFDQARAILSLIRPAFEAKEREAHVLRAGLNREREAHRETIRQMAAINEASEAKLAQAVVALEPFVQAFDAAREAHGRRYGNDKAIGLANFDKMPDRWPMDHLKFDMGTFRRARSASAAARGETSTLATSKEKP